MRDHSIDASLEFPEDEAPSSLDLHISVDSLQGQLPPDPGPVKVACLQPSDQLRDEPESNLNITRPDPKPPSEKHKSIFISSDQLPVLPPPTSLHRQSPPPALVPGHLSSYSYSSTLAPWLLFILSILSLSPQSQKQQRGLHGLQKAVSARPRRPPWLLLAASCFLLQTAPILAEELLAESSSEGPICTDGVFRGNIDINNRNEESKMSILAKYVNCSVVEGSISITSAIYNDQDTNYSMPNLTEVLTVRY